MGMCIYICIYWLNNLNRLTYMCLICEDILISVYIALYLRKLGRYLLELYGKVVFYMGNAEKFATRKVKYLMYILSTNFIGSLE